MVRGGERCGDGGRDREVRRWEGSPEKRGGKRSSGRGLPAETLKTLAVVNMYNATWYISTVAPTT